MRKFLQIHLIFCLLFITIGCNGNAETDESLDLHDIYSYEYNSIESEHNDLITKWISESRLSDHPISIHSISNDQQRYEYHYVFAKGYKAFEITFVFSSDSMDSKGPLHIVGIKGEEDEEILVKIKYDSRYVLGTIISDRRILSES